jgi:drug/metabolite transporter (DMT)-like permease
MNESRSSSEGAAEGQSDGLTWVAFFLIALFAGGNPVAVQFSNSGLPPFWGATLRFAGTALIFWLLVLVRGIALPRGRALLGTVVYGLLSVGGAYAGLYWGLLRAPAGLVGALLALMPLLTLFFAWAHGVERLRLRGLVGALIATGGVLLGVIGGFSGSVPLLSVLALVAGVASLAEASVVFKLFPHGHPIATNAVALTAGGPPLIALSLLTGEQWSVPGGFSTWAAYLYLVLVGSVGVFSLYLRVLSTWTASATSYVFLLMPVATVVIAAVVAGEVITLSFVIGTALVLAGVWIGAIRKAPEAAELVCSEMPSKALC